MSDQQPTKWAIISPLDGGGFKVVMSISETHDTLTFECDGALRVRQIGSECMIIARHDTEQSAIDGLTRAQAFEKVIRPFWQAALEHAIRLEQYMSMAVVKAAQPQEQQ